MNNEVEVLGNEFLCRAFENILINALKHNINSTKEIVINISKIQKDNNGYVKLEFVDNGIGIEDSQKELIFEMGKGWDPITDISPSYRKKKNVGGIGLGLSLVKKIIESTNGYIWVEDRIKGDYSQGSNFIILIPEA